MAKSQSAIEQITVSLDEEHFSPSDADGLLNVLRSRGLRSSARVMSRKSEISTVGLIWLGVKIAGEFSLVKFADLFIQQIYDAVLRDPLDALFARLKKEKREAGLVVAEGQRMLSIYPIDASDLREAMDQLHAVLPLLESGVDLPFNPDKVTLMGYTNGKWGVAGSDLEGRFEFDVSVAAFRPYTNPQMSPEDEKEWFLKKFGVELKDGDIRSG